MERILEYTRLPPEAALDSAPGHAPRSTWPEKGAIECRDLQVAYRLGLPLVLKGLTFRIEGGQRVGICGRTGSGKSSLIQALFRLMEPAGGALLIDGVDTAALGLHDLRRRIAVIPQNPFLFSGTVRASCWGFDVLIYGGLHARHGRSPRSPPSSPLLLLQTNKQTNTAAGESGPHGPARRRGAVDGAAGGADG